MRSCWVRSCLGRGCWRPSSCGSCGRCGSGSRSCSCWLRSCWGRSCLGRGCWRLSCGSGSGSRSCSCGGCSG